jgi:hypothetical protein
LAGLRLLGRDSCVWACWGCGCCVVRFRCVVVLRLRFNNRLGGFGIDVVRTELDLNLLLRRRSRCAV